ncbi:MAG: DUF1566 domain-containing protein [Alphaproteobacteria bacterium]|nr:DUF1566 domain-containing protein [Alphaproteobacteria bacterium]
MIKMFLFVLLVFPLVSEATTCVKDYAGTASCVENENTAGDCKTLGYSNQDVSGCTNYLYCPFNTNYKRCVAGGNELDCEELGYTTDDKSAWCGKILTCPNDSRLTSCSAGLQLCALGDVFYSDGSCGNVYDYDDTKIPVGVVYALSETKGGIPYTTQQAEADGFKRQHGRVINLRNLTSDNNTYLFNPENPYDNSYNKIIFGLYDTTPSGVYTYNTDTIQNSFEDEAIYNGKLNTLLIANTSPTYSYCTTTYQPGTAIYNQYCMPIVVNAALSFYPPNVNTTDSIVGAGKWYLPAIGELALLQGFKASQVTSNTIGATGTTQIIINDTLDILASYGIDADTISNGYLSYHWSSTPSDDGRYWELDMGNGYLYHMPTNDSKYIRVSLEF